MFLSVLRATAERRVHTRASHHPGLGELDRWLNSSWVGVEHFEVESTRAIARSRYSFMGILEGGQIVPSVARVSEGAQRASRASRSFAVAVQRRRLDRDAVAPPCFIVARSIAPLEHGASRRAPGRDLGVIVEQVRRNQR